MTAFVSEQSAVSHIAITKATLNSLLATEKELSALTQKECFTLCLKCTPQSFRLSSSRLEVENNRT